MQNKEYVDAGVGLDNKQINDSVRVIRRSDGKRRVVIFRRPDSLYSYREDVFYDHEIGKYWAPLGNSSTICDTADCAEREARVAISWLIQEKWLSLPSSL